MYNSRKPDPFNPKKHAKSEQHHFQFQVSFPNNFFRWFFTLLVLASVLLFVFHITEEKDFLELLEHANPVWIIAGVALQLMTYYAQAWIWKIGLRVSHHEIEASQLVGLSVAQLFMNQALPSVSVSGALLVSKALGQKGISHPDVAVPLGLNLISYFEAYALAILIAVIQLGLLGYLEVSSVIFINMFLLLYCLGLLFMIRRIKLSLIMHLPFVQKYHFIEKLKKIVEGMDFQKLSHPLILKGTLLQFLIFALDFLTLWSMLSALGISVAAGPVFSTFMAAYIARSLIFLPGGLGVFEAAAIASLHHAGVTLAGSIAATLLYRGLSFWLPMVPGLFLARREFHHNKRIQRYKIDHYWSLAISDVLKSVRSQPDGLSSFEAKTRLILQGPNEIHEHRSLAVWEIFWNQIKSPLVLLLVFACGISFFVGEWIDALIIFTIILVGSGIGTWREKGAQSAIEQLKMKLALKTKVKRDGTTKTIPSAELVQGDVVYLSAGSMVPADVLILKSQDCYVNEAAISGESFPVLKSEGGSAQEKKNAMFVGSHVQTGTAECLIVNTGISTIFGTITESLNRAGPQTDFDRGITSFGYMMLKAMLMIVVGVFAINSFTSGLTIESLMFSVALAVGLNPELLPLIVNYNLSRSARLLVKQGLLVRHPKALENIAAMDTLCTDKTGTLTEGVVEIEGAYDINGARSETVLKYAGLNASLQTGMANPLDEILKKISKVSTDFKMLGEIPYDFKRKRLSVIIEEDGLCKVITKGAFQKVIDICGYNFEGKILDEEGLRKINGMYEEWSRQGARVLAVAIREVPVGVIHEPGLEEDMRLLGLLVFTDRPKKMIIETLKELKALGVKIKIISGDNTLVTQAVARQVGLEPGKILEGKDIDALSDEALPPLAEEMELFTQVDPHQKERIVTALRKKGHTVGYMGDGINDVSAMHASDASISVDGAVDVAQSTADLVLLEKNLQLIVRGIKEGRNNFVNSMKYINITMSANLGNMMSMAVASIMLPFLPLLAGQVLLNNFLSDIPSLGLAGDNVEEFRVKGPTKWNLGLIFRYMIIFGLISSLFDLLTFYVLIKVFKVSVNEFRTSWFLESLLTELLVVMVLRTTIPIYKSRPAKLLSVLTVVLIIISLLIPYMPYTRILGFVPLKLSILGFVVGITICYLFATEMMKAWLLSHAFKRSGN